MKLSYEVQEEAGGIAQALGLARTFAAGEKVAVILGDNIIEDDLSQDIKDFSSSEGGAKIFLKSVHNPESYGVAFVEGQRISQIVEKPSDPSSDLAVIGAYFYDNEVFSIVETLKPSDRNELEITDVNNHYLSKGTLSYKKLEGFWGDCGESFESLLDASIRVKESNLSSINSNLDL